MDFYSTFTEQQLLTEIAECVSLRKETERRQEQAEKALLALQTSTGELTVEHDGWTSTMQAESFTGAYIKRRYGYDDKELPPTIFTEKISLVVDPDKARQWLDEEGRDVDLTYRLVIRKKPMKAPTND